MHWLITSVWLLQVLLPLLAPQCVALQVYAIYIYIFKIEFMKIIE